jgi:splicing factor 3B subunit 2
MDGAIGRAGLMGSAHVYDISAATGDNVRAAPASGDGIDVALDPSELDLVDAADAMKAKYDEQLRRRQAAGLDISGQEDLSDMVAEHAARQKVRNSTDIFAVNVI